MRKLLSLALASMLTGPAFAGAQEVAGAWFRAQEIDKSLKVGYAVRLVDLNGDGKLDIVVPDSERVIWFENPGGKGGSADAAWKLHTILDDKKAGIKTDNVCIAVADIDGDGKPDIALGADWQPSNTKGGGSLHWLRQPSNIDQTWEVHPILESEPTLHRINFADLDGSGKPLLIVAPLKGRNTTQGGNFMEAGTRLLAFKIPADPAKGPWEPTVLTDQLHVNHNFLPVHWDPNSKGMQLLTASYEGVNLLTPGEGGKSTLMQLGTGDTANPKANHGSSEIKLGRLKDRKILATIEPFHGNQVVVYTPPADGKGLWTRTVLDDTFKEGHGIWCADFDGDGNDEVIAGWRAGPNPAIRIYKATVNGSGTPTWQKHDLDVGGVAVEDLACGDLNGDGRIDVVAVGRATHNVKIYWNESNGGGAK
jgi:hypothetical protein